MTGTISADGLHCGKLGTFLDEMKDGEGGDKYNKPSLEVFKTLITNIAIMKYIKLVLLGCLLARVSVRGYSLMEK